MKPQDSFDDFLAEHLRHAQDYVPDDGFSASVMSALPIPKKPSRWLEFLIIVIPLALTSILVFSQFPILSSAARTLSWLLEVNSADWVKYGAISSVAITLMCVFWMRQTAE
jgi:hypothetical protein